MAGAFVICGSGFLVGGGKICVFARGHPRVSAAICVPWYDAVEMYGNACKQDVHVYA
jgi:hypothetical protein